MNRKITIFFGTLLLACSLSGAVLAKDGQHCRHYAPDKAFGRGYDHLLDGLGLTEEQESQINEIRQAKREKMSGSWEKRKDFHKELMEAVENNASEKELRKLIEKQNAARTDKMVEMLKTRQQILAVLTDDQRVKLKEKRQKMMEKMEQRMDNKPSPSEH